MFLDKTYSPVAAPAVARPAVVYLHVDRCFICVERAGDYCGPDDLARPFILGVRPHNYSLAVDDHSVSVKGGRVIRKGHVGYLREINTWPWRGGPRLVLSEHSAAWVHLFGGVIVVPNGLPEYEQIKRAIATWTIDSAAQTAGR